MSTGVLARAACIGAIYKRGVRLTPKARAKFTHATLVNFVSTDVSLPVFTRNGLAQAWRFIGQSH